MPEKRNVSDGRGKTRICETAVFHHFSLGKKIKTECWSEHGKKDEEDNGAVIRCPMTGGGGRGKKKFDDVS